MAALFRSVYSVIIRQDSRGYAKGRTPLWQTLSQKFGKGGWEMWSSDDVRLSDTVFRPLALKNRVSLAEGGCEGCTETDKLDLPLQFYLSWK